MTADFYDILGVDEDASKAEIQSAFRDRVRKYHPDLNDDPRAPAQFTALKKAYDTLGDPKERSDYDRLGHEKYCQRRINGLPDPEDWALQETGRIGGVGADADAPVTPTGGVGPGAVAGDGDSRSTNDGRGWSMPSVTVPLVPSPGRLFSRLSEVTPGLPQVRVGWPLVFLVDVCYIFGLGAYLLANVDGLRAYAAVAGATDPVGALSTSHGVGSVPAFVRADLTNGLPVGGLAFVVGAMALPLVYGFVIRETRRLRAVWRPSYLYALAAGTPLAGVAVEVTTSLPGLYVLAVCYLLAPVGAVVALPTSAFVLPRVRRTVRRLRRRFE